MKSYFEVLRNYARTPFGEAVAAEGTSAAPAVSSAEELRADLKGISKRDAKYFNVCAGMVTLLFAGAFVFVVTNLHNPNTVKLVFAITGVSFGGLITQMIALWKEKVHSDMVLLLAGKLPPDELKTIIGTLLSG